MKVTAILPDEIVSDVKKLAHGKNITDSLLIALEEWIAIKRIIALNNEISESPLRFRDGFSARDVRTANRSR
ncbi:MAG: DUF2191 domain-containing protein [Spirochaetes bacterium]|nr:MAG: DUF2191 domain-containing protein [Spirochaetota bacterium]